MLEAVITKWGGKEVSAMEVYTDIFHLGYGKIQSEKKEEKNMVANPIGYWKDGEFSDKTIKGHFRIMFEDTFSKRLKELQEAQSAILNGITYFGRKNLQAHASKMYAMIFDLDGVTDTTLNAFFSGAHIDDINVYPIPNYIAMSGNGVHLYYLFEEPLPLFPNIKIQLKELKYALTEKIWNTYTSKLKVKQFQGINQGFRVIGGKTKIEGVRVRAFQMNTHPFSLEQLCRYVPDEYRVDESKLFKESKLTLIEAKKKYPEWYKNLKEFTDENKKRKEVGAPLLKRRHGTWQCKTDLYNWWLRKIKDGATYHHRYFSIMCLAIYAIKSGVDFETLEQDAYKLVPFLNDINPDEPFTETDCQSALECYDQRYCTFPIDDIIKLSGIAIEKNKRNGRNQADHIKLMNYIRDNINANKNWRDGNGRPKGSSKEKVTISEWRFNNPKGTKADCIRDTGISKKTVYRWWNVDLIEKAVYDDEKKHIRG